MASSRTSVKKHNNTDDSATVQADIVADLRAKIALRPEVIKDLETALQPKIPRMAMNSSWPSVIAARLLLYAEACNTTPNRILQMLVLEHLPVILHPTARTPRRRDQVGEKTS